jgi:hypothetical protein
VVRKEEGFVIGSFKFNESYKNRRKSPKWKDGTNSYSPTTNTQWKGAMVITTY